MKLQHYVYKTTCNITQHYYLGVHSSKGQNDTYIGSGIKFLNYVKKYGRENFSKEIIKYFSTRDEAFAFERELLTEATLADEMCLNLMEGGRGWRHAYDETFKERISKTRKKLINQGKITPTKHTEEHKRRLRENNPGGKATSKPIYQINTTGQVVNTWPSSRQAGIQLRLKSWRNLSALANKKSPQTAYGFYWRWVGDVDVIDNQLLTIDEMEKKRNDVSYRAGRQIKQTILTTGVETTWKNMCEAARQLNIDNSAISLAIKTGRPYAGSTWIKV